MSERKQFKELTTPTELSNRTIVCTIVFYRYNMVISFKMSLFTSIWKWMSWPKNHIDSSKHTKSMTPLMPFRYQIVWIVLDVCCFDGLSLYCIHIFVYLSAVCFCFCLFISVFVCLCGCYFFVVVSLFLSYGWILANTKITHTHMWFEWINWFWYDCSHLDELWYRMFYRFHHTHTTLSVHCPLTTQYINSILFRTLFCILFAFYFCVYVYL